MICYTAHISNIDGDVFFKQLNEKVDEVNRLSCEVEIKYQTSSLTDGLVIFSALIIGRKPNNADS